MIEGCGFVPVTENSGRTYSDIRKFLKGAAKYGTFEPAADNRDPLSEAELLVAINYFAMFLLKVRAMQRKAAKQASNETKKRGLRKINDHRPCRWYSKGRQLLTMSFAVVLP